MKGPAELLEHRIELFCQKYASCFNGTQAYLEAVDDTVERSSAATYASKWLAKPEIRARVAEIIEEHKRTFNLEAGTVLHELACIGFATIGDLLGPDGLVDPEKIAKAPDDVKRAIESIDLDEKGNLKVRFYSKTSALRMLGEKYRMFTQKVEHSDPDGNPLNVMVTFVKAGTADKAPEEAGDKGSPA